MRSGARPSVDGQDERTSLWLAPIPPEVTITACAPSSNSPTGVRELGCPRATELGSSTVPATPATAPPLEVMESTRCRNFSVTRPRVTPSRTALERLEHARPGAPGD